MRSPSSRPLAARHHLAALAAVAALAGLAGCGSSSPAKPVERAPAVPGPSLQVTTGAACGTGTPHDQYAAAGIGCTVCHPSPNQTTLHGAAWMDTTPTNTGFHGYAANQGLAACATCHGANLDGVSASTTVSCAGCHGAAWKTSCTMCHGGTDNATGAPPRATWANAADTIRSGTHTAHLGATHGLAAPVACEACHVVPADVTTAGHIDGATASVAFSGLAVQGSQPAWARASATCASTYCHGATLIGGGQKTPVWTTADGSQRGCGSCHGAPPANLSHGRRDLDCGACHPGYTATSVNAATHIDGTIQFSVTCTSCHGTGSPSVQANIAPPKGSEGETLTTALAVGAHAQHLVAANMQVANPFTCDACHVLPQEPLHMTGPVDLAFGTLANKRPDPGQTSTYFTGTSTSATTTTMTDTAKNFGGNNALRNVTLRFLSGTFNGTTRTITNSTATVVRWNTTQPVAGLTGAFSYQIGNPPTPITPPALASWNRTTGKCSNVWCHGFNIAAGGLSAANVRGYPTHNGTTTNFTSPAWTTVNGTQDTCSGCHGRSGTNPGYPSTGRHSSPTNHVASCGRCHGGTYTTTVADKSRHVNGVVENTIGFNPNTNSCNATGSGCHGTTTMSGWY